MPNFRNGKIYEIISDHTKKVYIGSTVLKLNIRLNIHKNHYKKWKQGQFDYLSSFQVVKYRDARIRLVEVYPCLTLEELLIREQYWKDNIEKCCNKNRAFRIDTRRRNSTRKWNKNNQINCDYCDQCYSKGQKMRRHEQTQKHQDNVKFFNSLFD
jgi:GIY-YIG catalytic domain